MFSQEVMKHALTQCNNNNYYNNKENQNDLNVLMSCFFPNVLLKEELCHDVLAADTITWKINFRSNASRSDTIELH